MEPKGVIAASQPRWMDAKTNPPKKCEDVLIYSYWHEAFQRMIGFYDPYSKEWFMETTIGVRKAIIVTHWMPMPEPPKEVENAGTP